MATLHTDLAQVVNGIQTFWAPDFDMKLLETFKLAALINKTPGGIGMIREGDTIKVNQINEMTGAIQDINASCVYDTEILQSQQVEIKVDRRAYAALSFCDLDELMSQINMNRPDVRDKMAHAMASQINTYLYGKVSCTVDNPTTAVFDASELVKLTKQANQAFWPTGNRWLFVDPCYYADLMSDATLVSGDFGSTDRVVIGGEIVNQRYGWNIVVDNSAAMLTALNGGAPGVALAFLPDFMGMVRSYENRVKVSDAHSNCEWRFRMTVDSVFGADLLNDGADKCITTRTGA